MAKLPYSDGTAARYPPGCRGLAKEAVAVGMLLTQNRLDLLAGIPESGEERLVRETVWDESVVMVGARVRIWIPLMN